MYRVSRSSAAPANQQNNTHLYSARSKLYSRQRLPTLRWCYNSICVGRQHSFALLFIILWCFLRLPHYASVYNIQQSRILGDIYKGIFEETRHRNCLELVHITKTGGSAIERAGGKVNITWGACHYPIPEKYRIPLSCPSPDTYFDHHNVTKFANTPIWHIPPRYFQGETPYGKCDTFTVVRNPYERAVSEFYCPHSGYRGEGINNAEIMNRWIRNMLQKKDHERFIPQNMYVFDDSGNKVVDHVLHFENLVEEFNGLMGEYNLPARLTTQKHNQRIGIAKLTAKDLTKPTIKMINMYAIKDFVKFGYDMLPPIPDDVQPIDPSGITYNTHNNGDNYRLSPAAAIKSKRLALLRQQRQDMMRQRYIEYLNHRDKKELPETRIKTSANKEKTASTAR